MILNHEIYSALNVKEDALIEVIFQTPNIAKPPRLLIHVTKALESSKVIKSHISLLSVYNDIIKFYINQQLYHRDDVKSKDEIYKEVSGKYQVIICF